ncbi:adenylyl-sulfate kinase [Chromohalobacter israelensis]|uniref:adenylyl-sulfate kinase n=1 Tax=Chromohalobacter israelensis TaxID=141390 RepID=UPI000D70EFB3|nr:adenylyl-sulfate kinase [Chromohalobacter salexigens]PWW36486.1 adenylylsulfate kinase [Chromohalobacter salexigens]
MPKDIVHHAHKIARSHRERLNGHKACLLWFTGLSGSGKSTIASLVEEHLHAMGKRTYLLDGDNVRHGLNRDLGFSDRDRVENIRRIGEMSRLFVDAGMITLTAFISPFRADRDAVRERMAAGDFVEVFIDTPLATCEQRDPKGLYQRARRGLIKDFTGIDSPYEPPEAPELHIVNDGISPEEAAVRVIRYLQAQGYLPRQNLPTLDEA